MTKEEAKAQIILGLNQNTINILIDKLAESIAENDELKKKLADDPKAIKTTA